MFHGCRRSSVPCDVKLSFKFVFSEFFTVFAPQIIEVSFHRRGLGGPRRLRRRAAAAAAAATATAAAVAPDHAATAASSSSSAAATAAYVAAPCSAVLFRKERSDTY